MKKLFKNKKFVIGFVVILLILVVGICFTAFRSKDTENEAEENMVLKNGTFTAYIKINPLVKLTFDTSYYECTNNDGSVSICGKYTDEVTKAELLNDDANSIYKDIDFKGKDLFDSILAIVETAKDNGYDISNIAWTTDWNYQVDDLKNKITDKVKEDTNVEITINFNYQETIDEAGILESENIKAYSVKFDSNGGTNVKTETIAENKVATKPTDPTKDGYTFVEWQLNGKTYDFNSKVTDDITLKAKWKKKSSTSSNTNTGANTNTNTNSDSNKTNSTDNNNTTDDSSSNNNTTTNDSSNNNTPKETTTKEQDNETLKAQLKAKGLQWDFNNEEDAKNKLYLWMENGYGGDVYENSYGNSDIAYSVVVTLDAKKCHSNDVITVNWRDYTKPVDFIYYLYSHGYDCSGNSFYRGDKSCTINENNELNCEQ